MLHYVLKYAKAQGVQRIEQVTSRTMLRKTKMLWKSNMYDIAILRLPTLDLLCHPSDTACQQ